MRLAIDQAVRRPGPAGLDLPPRPAGRLERGPGLRRGRASGTRRIVGARRPQVPARRPFATTCAGWRSRTPHRPKQHWRTALAGFTSPTELPARPPAPARPTAPRPPARSASRWTTTDSARLREMAQRTGLTMNTVLQGAWALLLSRYSGERDVVFGTTVSGRPADAARRGVHGRHVHQHPAHPGTGRRAARAAGLAARPADRAVRGPALRLRLAGRAPGLERSARRDQPVRQHRGLRELPVRQRRPRPARPGHPAGTRPGADQLPAQRGRRPRRTPHRRPSTTTRRPSTPRRSSGWARACASC